MCPAGANFCYNEWKLVNSKLNARKSSTFSLTYLSHYWPNPNKTWQINVNKNAQHSHKYY